MKVKLLPNTRDGNGLIKLLSMDLKPNAAAVLDKAIMEGTITTDTLLTILPDDLLENQEKTKKVINGISQILRNIEVILIVDKAKKERKARRKRSEVEEIYDDEDDELEIEEGERRPSAITDGITSYFDQIGEYPLLSKDEEYALGVASMEGDMEARKKLVKHNLRLVISIAKDYRGSGLPFEDLIQCGNLGLWTAAEKFNPALGRFTTNAWSWVKQSIQRGLMDDPDTIRKPVHVHETINELGRIREALCHKLDRFPTDTEVFSEARNDPKIGSLDLAIDALDISTTSLDEELDIVDGSCWERHIFTADPTAWNPIQLIEARRRFDNVEKRLREFIASVKELVPDGRNQTLFFMRYGLDGYVDNFTLESLGEKVHLTRERVRQIILGIWAMLQANGIQFDEDTLIEEMAQLVELEKITSVATNGIMGGDVPLPEPKNQTEAPVVSNEKVLVSNPENLCWRNALRTIIECVSTLVGVPKEDILAGEGVEEVIFIRQVVMFLLKTDFKVQLSEISAMFPRGGHAFVWQSVKKITGMMVDDVKTIDMVTKIREEYTLAWYCGDFTELEARQSKLYSKQVVEATQLIESSEDTLDIQALKRVLKL